MARSRALADLVVYSSGLMPFFSCRPIPIFRNRPSARFNVVASSFTMSPSATVVGVVAAGVAGAALAVPPPLDVLKKYPAAARPTASTTAGIRLLRLLWALAGAAASAGVSDACASDFLLAMSAARFLCRWVVDLGKDDDLDPPVVGSVGIGVVGDQRLLVGVARRGQPRPGQTLVVDQVA